MGEQHFDLLPPPPRDRVLLCLGDVPRHVPRHVPRALADRAQHLAGWPVRAAAGLQRAGAAVVLRGAVAHEASGIDAEAGPRESAPAVQRFLAARAGVETTPVVAGGVRAAEGAVGPPRLAEDRDVRLDPPPVDQPAEHRRRAVAGVGDQALGPEAEGLGGPDQHVLSGAGLRLAHRRAGLDADDRRVVRVDRVVVAVGVAGRAAGRRRPARGGIGGRDELWRDLGGRAEGGVVRHGEVLCHGATGVLRVKLRGAGDALPPAGVRADHAGVDCEALTADDPPGHAAAHRRPEEAPQRVAVAEAAVPVLGEGGVVRHPAVQPEAAEPAAGEAQVDLLARPPFGADAAAAADQRHADRQLGVHRWTPDRAVERLESPPDAAQLDEAVDRAQQVIGGDVLLEAEAVEQRLLPDLPLAHHGRALLRQED